MICFASIQPTDYTLPTWDSGEEKVFQFSNIWQKKYFGNYTLNFMKNVWNGAISLAMLDNQKCVACKFCFTEQSETNSLEPLIFFFKITFQKKYIIFFHAHTNYSVRVFPFSNFNCQSSRPVSVELSPNESNLIGWVKVRIHQFSQA